tara:strand:+ start:188 stop:1111 length:924 start_codon:yes stop_codon:yes gene_type:complete
MDKSEELIKCPICASGDIFYRSKYIHRNLCFESLKLYNCNTCHLNFSHPNIDAKKLTAYNSSYHQNAHDGHNRNSKLESFFSGISKLRIITIRESYKVKKNCSVLEIGSGPGYFIKEWLKQFPQTKYTVFEPDKVLHSTLESLGVDFIFDINRIKNNNFDIIIISHVLEHVQEPYDFITPLKASLKKGGIFFIEVPCRDWIHKVVHEPHLLFFEKKSFQFLAKKLNLKILKSAYYGTTLKNLLNRKIIFLKKIRSFLWKYNITYYHKEKKRLNKLIRNRNETEALINFDAHIEQQSPSWWLRVILKK